jgi:DNA-binding transcriptional MerR regulator
VIKKWKQRQQLAKWLKDHGKNLEEINSLLEQWGKGEQVDLITVQQLIENIYI